MNIRVLKILWGTLAISWAVTFGLLRVGVMVPKWPWVMPMFLFGAIGFSLLWFVCLVSERSEK